ncbi:MULTISPECIES: gamma carbonic anhydrase family protein [Prosthecochloris]|uniref:Gamma carbonic anhydrase family protein n=1 Tax=Prosthecochloris vibrioformis TaxID=1098 RepID=A0A5C4S318_PROVB|nr:MULTISPECIES: gamma carbonic anhydrase family protein [Prosthecochloris]ANT65743.1 2,3,4,5-tetrahydropyridine-2,6-dicarboxylate N-acetyltransferase [Prosthecochloris sp. CIB 2401]TNJ37883.1 gamma carbonic anhydrase family protein [Prosthecochloris vibrioformis]
MATILPYKGVYPRIHESVFLAEGACVIGDVEIGEDSSVWFNAVIRGDVCPITIGCRTSVQDNAALHVTHDTGPLHIGSDVTIGHGAVLHACRIEDHVLVGMGSTLLDDCVAEPFSIVAAGALVRQGFAIPSGMLAAGVPAKIMRPLTDTEKKVVTESPGNYVRYVAEYRAGGYEGRQS